MDQHARIVIIGGGAIGCSVAYHLARAGERDVLLLEKSGLTHGATWHAAGLVGQLRAKRNLTRLMQDSVAVFDRLVEEVGQEIDWRKVGSLRIASSEARWSEIKRTLTQAKSFGFQAEQLSAEEARELFPFMTTEGVVGAAFIPSDGYVDPYGLTQAYAKGARQSGATLREGVQVTDLIVERGRVTAVVTDHGTIACEVLVNCAGMWAKRIGQMAGVSIAAGAVEHQYLVTEKAIDFAPGLPTFRDPDRLFYLKPDVGSFAVGGWEQGTKACWRDGVPFDFGRELFESNFERFEQVVLPAAERVPVLNDVGIQTLINGPIPVSADGEPIMGLAPELDNFYLACGFTAGIAASGGAGQAMANWILEGDPGMDLWAFDARRFGPPHARRRFLEDRMVEAYGRYYALHWPGEEMASARGARRSPLHETLKAAGAVHGSKFGWERPNWFAPKGTKPVDRPSFEERPNWFDAVGQEHRAVRERVALIDQSSFTKFEVSGPGAFDFLQGLAANDLDRPRGACVYTQLCNQAGGIEADLTILRTGEAVFYVVTGSGFGVRDGAWLREHLPDDGSVVLHEVSEAKAVINLCGPLARQVLERVTDDDVSNDGLPYMTARNIEIGYAPVLAARVGYVGELGYELHLPVDYAGHAYETLWAAGEDLGVANVGYRAIESLRLEKGYLYWSADITPDTNPYEAGLGFCVALDKGPFLGREALARINAEGPGRRLCSFTLPAEAPLYGGEAILRAGRVVGVTTSGGYGYTLERAVALGYLAVEDCEHEDYQIEAFGRSFPARRGRRTLYDPGNQRLRA
jgi:4-methylaminobutanoate oxidase (formaldehyde-forming)